MKLLSRNRQHGGTLIVTLILGITVGTVLGAYLSLVSNRYELTMRSQCWNTSVPVLEAGIEEALTHLHDDPGLPASNGWTNGTVGGQSIYAKARTFSDGSSYYTVIYNATTLQPYIYSTGMVPAPRKPNTYISRTVKVTGTNAPLINAAFAAIYGITMNGSSLAADSFNSSLPTLSTNGLYDPTKTSTNGSVASVYGPVNLGQHTIKGNLYLGPSALLVSSPGNVLGSIYSDFNVSYPDVTLPTTNWTAVTNSTVNGTTVHDIKATGYYVVPANDNIDLIVESNVTAFVKVLSTSYQPNNIHVMGTGTNSGTLNIYQVSGNGTLNNVVLDSGKAQNFFYYGLPGVTTIAYKGNNTFTGVIYAPEADMTLSGGGSSSGFIGACVTKSITMNGNNFTFHFDEALLTYGPGRGLVVNSWQEL